MCLGAPTKEEEKGRGSGNLGKVKLAGLGADWLEKGKGEFRGTQVSGFQELLAFDHCSH